MNQKEFSKILKEKLHGTMTMEEFAKAVGVSYQAVYNWENGIKFPYKKNLAKALKVLKIKKPGI